MHYCVHLLTKELPTENQIAEILQPYNGVEFWENIPEDMPYEEVEHLPFTWDCYQIGGRYKAQLKLKVDENDNTYNWMLCGHNPRNGRLFWCSLLSTLQKHITPSFMYSEEDWFSSLGISDGYIRVDGAKLKDVLNLDDLGCYIYILPDGSAVARSSWNGNSFIEDKNFDDKYAKALEDNMNVFITVIDIHD